MPTQYFEHQFKIGQFVSFNEEEVRILELSYLVSDNKSYGGSRIIQYRIRLPNYQILTVLEHELEAFKQEEKNEVEAESNESN